MVTVRKTINSYQGRAEMQFYVMCTIVFANIKLNWDDKKVSW